MHALVIALFVIGLIVHGAGYFWLVVLAYREAPGAGRVALFVWPLAFLVPLMRWDEVVLKALLLAGIGLGMAWGGYHLLWKDSPAEDAAPEFRLDK